MFSVLLKTRLGARTGKAHAKNGYREWDFDAVCHPQTALDDYVLKEIVRIDAAFPSVIGFFGDTVLRLQGRHSGETLYVYGQPEHRGVMREALGVPTKDFAKMLTAIKGGDANFTVAIQKPWFLFGTQPLTTGMADYPANLLEYKERPKPVAPPKAVEPVKPVMPLSAPSRPDVAPKVSRPSTPAAKPAVRPVAAPVSRAVPFRTGYRTQDEDNGDSFGDFMFMSMFPDVAPFYRPNSLLAWYMWFNYQHDRPSGGAYRYVGDVPGFEGAASQRVVPTANGQEVELFDANGVSLGRFQVMRDGDEAQIRTMDGQTFYLQDRAGSPSLSYSNGQQSFNWDGTSDPVIAKANETIAWSVPEDRAPEPIRREADSADAGEGVSYTSRAGDAFSNASTRNDVPEEALSPSESSNGYSQEGGTAY